MRLKSTLLAFALSLPLAMPVQGAGSAGSYLAARQASYTSDFSAALLYYTRALATDPSNPVLLENVMGANVSLGDIERAVPVARRALAAGIPSQVAGMVMLTDLLSNEDFDALLADDESVPKVGNLVDKLIRAWALVGSGQVTEALAYFDELGQDQAIAVFAHYHKALALASMGDFEGADEILSGRAHGPLQVSRRGIIAHTQILSQLDRGDDAADLIRSSFGANPVPLFQSMLDDLEAGKTLEFDVATSAEAGAAEVFYSVATALVGETAPGYVLLYTRVAQHLNPTNIDAVLLSASLLEDLQQYDLATKVYDTVPRTSPAFLSAELGRADALRADGKVEASVEALHQLAKSHPDRLIVQTTLGDTLRREERFEEALPAYNQAIDLLGEPRPEQWPLFFSRGIVLERTDNWEAAEADFRQALSLRPDEPQVLNYLGYSLVEKDLNLDEALDMIERAVAGRPDDGYITDSLGWVLYRLGRYDEAIVHMERAAELMPVDPIINDHLGDVLWSVGRELEARFQWRRAMSFDPEEEELIRIRRKLEIGLDAVLEEEGAEPLAALQDG